MPFGGLGGGIAFPSPPTASVAVPLPSEFGAGLPAFERSSTVTVGPQQVQNVGLQRGLRVVFEVKRTLKAKEPNTCDLKVWGLSDSTLATIAQASTKSTVVAAPPTGIPGVAGKPVKVIPVQIDAGYVGQTSTIFLGEMRSAQSVTDGPEIITELNTGDGDVALGLQRMNASFLAGTTPQQVVQALLAQAGIGSGNLAAALPIFARAQGTLFVRGVTLKTNPARALADICASVGLEFSIQNGAAQFLSLGQPLAGKALLISPTSGLIGTPTVDTVGICSFVSLILPGLNPGAPVQLDSKFVQGTFRILSVEYSGDTWGNEWYCKCEAASQGVAP
jgi:hypothetical protein